MTTARKFAQFLRRFIATATPGSTQQVSFEASANHRKRDANRRYRNAVFAWLVLVLAALPVAPDLDRSRAVLTELHAQLSSGNCARCINCRKCKRSDWGAGYCTFESRCCNEEGGNCNPALALSVPSGDRRAHGQDEDLVVRLTANVFGTWSCVDGRLAVAYREEGGVLTPVGNAEFRNLENRYSLAQYIAILNDQPTTPRRIGVHDRQS